LPGPSVIGSAEHRSNEAIGHLNGGDGRGEDH
jgi:hypothetical protein